MNDANRHSSTSRRDLLRLGAISPFAVGAASAGSGPSSPAPQAETVVLTPPNRFSRMVHEQFLTQVRKAHQQSVERKAALKTRAEAQAYVRSLRDKIRSCFGPFPEKTPLNARVTGVLERDTYKIEKVIFESRPGFLVSANLYIPKGRPFPLPGVVGTCGHAHIGKAHDTYQSFSQGLAKQGYVVLLKDPIGQGERMQYLDQELKPRRGTGTGEHLYGGNQQFLVGEFFGTWRAWDGIRSLDYLISRPEVDSRHLGVVGQSGGGTMTTWLCGLDERYTMAAPSCFVVSFLRNFENELPADTEQCPPRALALGLEHEDFIAAMAPRPVVLLAQERDYFDVRGAEAIYERLKRFYTLLGAPGNIELHVGPGSHNIPKEAREAMYRCFNRATGISKEYAEPEIVLEKEEELWCAPRGQVATLNSRPMYEFTRESSRRQAAARKPLSGQQLTAAVNSLLKLPGRSGVPEFRILRPWRSRRYPTPHHAVYAVETEPNIHALVYRLSPDQLLSRPPRSGKRAVLYVSHRSSDVELREEPLTRELFQAEPETPLFTCDLRGMGESQPDTCGENTYRNPYGNDYFYAIHSIMLDYPYLGQRTFDVLRVLDWMASFGHAEVHLAAKGWGALPAAFAALLSPGVVQVTLKNALSSYAEIAESENYAWPLSALLPGVLARFDMPDVYRALESKRLKLIEPWGAAPAV